MTATAQGKQAHHNKATTTATKQQVILYNACMYYNSWIMFKAFFYRLN